MDSIKANERREFIEFYKKLTKSKDVLRLFRRSNGDFYTAHGEDAIVFSTKLYNTQSILRYWCGDINTGLCSCSITGQVKVLTNFAKKHINEFSKIEIWSYCETKNSNKKEWNIVNEISTSNFNEIDQIFISNLDRVEYPIIMAVNITTNSDGLIVVGLAFTDKYANILYVSQFVDNDLLNNMESILINQEIKECVLSDKSNSEFERHKLKQILSLNNIVVTEINKNFFDQSGLKNSLNKLWLSDSQNEELKEIDNWVNNENLEFSYNSLACLIKYLKLEDDNSNRTNYKFQTYDLTNYMKLNSAAFLALNVLPSSNSFIPQNTNVLDGSMFSLLNQCKTTQGSRLLTQYLRQPLTNLAEIEKRLDLVTVFYNNQDVRNTLNKEILTKVPDLYKLSKKFLTTRAGLQDVIRIYQTSKLLPMCLRYLELMMPNTLICQTYMEPMDQLNSQLSKFKRMVETTIDLERADTHHEYVIRSQFNNELQAIEKQRNNIMSQLNQAHINMANQLGMDSNKKCKLELSSIHGYCFRVSRLDHAALRRHSALILELGTQKSGVFFTTKEVRDLSKDYKTFTTEYNKKQVSLVKEVIDITITYIQPFQILNNLFADLDLKIAFANTASNSSISYTRPRFSLDDAKLELIDSRHPTIEQITDSEFIPNDAKMNFIDRQFLIVTGPNMGGKSTYIRQIGMISLLAQIGSYVPASSAVLPIFDSILVRVGASDNLMKGVSTFMAEMLETSTILKSATKNSLIIVDELGRGTSTYDGFGLAWGISEHIVKNIGCFTLFATHFHELTELSNTYREVKNLHVVVGNQDTDQLTLLYKIEDGVCDESFGLHVAKIVQFPQSLINVAKRKLEGLNQCFIDSDSSDDQFDKIKCGIKRLINLVDHPDSFEYKSEIQKLKALDYTKKLMTEFRK